MSESAEGTRFVYGADKTNDYDVRVLFDRERMSVVEITARPGSDDDNRLWRYVRDWRHDYIGWVEFPSLSRYAIDDQLGEALTAAIQFARGILHTGELPASLTWVRPDLLEGRT